MNKYIFIVVCMAVVSCYSCKKNSVADFDNSRDSIKGIWGQTLLYNEFGEKLQHADSITIKAFCTNISDAIDTVFITKSDAKGNWNFRNIPSGTYFIECGKAGFATNTFYNFFYDTLRADTLQTNYLSKKNTASLVLDSVWVESTMLYLARTVYFTAQHANPYYVSTWYFFDTVPHVQPHSCVYAYVSGATEGNAQEANYFVTKKPLEKLTQYGIAQGSTVYVAAATDNAKYISFLSRDSLSVFPNISDVSEVSSFVMPIDITGYEY